MASDFELNKLDNTIDDDTKISMHDDILTSKNTSDSIQSKLQIDDMSLQHNDVSLQHDDVSLQHDDVSLHGNTTSTLHVNKGHYSPLKPIHCNDKNNYHTFSEKILSIISHVLIMACFETYFYFNYIILMERKLFLEKINSYFKKMDKYYDNYYDELNIDNKENFNVFVSYILEHHHEAQNYLYDQYQTSMKEQKELLSDLYHLSLMMLLIIFSIFCLALINALFIRKYIHWKNILMENSLMFILLGIFEYLFFTYIILLYTPITDSELQYIVYNNLIDIVNGTKS